MNYKKILLTLTAVLAAMFGAERAYNMTQLVEIPLHINDQFSAWKLKHSKTYNTPEEHNYRLGIYYANALKIAAHNAVGTHTYSLGINKFADLTPAEFKAKYMGYKPELMGPRNPAPVVEKVGVANPATVDHRKTGGVNPVKNQAQCGSCWAFSTIASLEFMQWQKTGNLPSLSEQQLVDCAGGKWQNQGCNGGLMDLAFKYVEANGIESEAAYPYRAQTLQCKYNAADVKVTNKSYTDVTPNSEKALEDAVAQRVVSIAADATIWQFYFGGVIKTFLCGNKLDHGINVVGYDNTANPPFWIVRNSWGPSWGEEGYLRIIKKGDGKGECGMYQVPSYPTE